MVAGSDTSAACLCCCLPGQAWAQGLNLCACHHQDGLAEDHSKSEMPAALTAASAALPALRSGIRAGLAVGVQGVFLFPSPQFNNSACANRTTLRTGCLAERSPGAQPPRWNPVGREGSSGHPQPSYALWPNDRNPRDGRSPERPHQLGQCPWLGSEVGESRYRPSCLLLQVEGEAKLCLLMPTCCGGAQNTARPSTTLRSARRTSRCSSWKCGAFKMSRSREGQALTVALMGMGTPCHAGCHRPACCGLCQQCHRHLRAPSSPSQSDEVV